MRLSTSEWRIIHRLDAARKERVVRAISALLVWLTALMLLGLCVFEGARIARETKAAGLSFQEVVSPRFEGLPAEQANAKHGAVVSVTLRAALVVLYFFLASFLFAVALSLRVYKRQDALAAKLVQRLRELAELE
jgi:hypothetical protein